MKRRPSLPAYVAKRVAAEDRLSFFSLETSVEVMYQSLKQKGFVMFDDFKERLQKQRKTLEEMRGYL